MKAAVFVIVVTYSVYAHDKPSKIINLLAPSNVGSEPFQVSTTNISYFDRYLGRLSKGVQPSVEDVVNSPVFAMATDGNNRNHLIYLRYGLRSIPRSLNVTGFEPIAAYLKTPGIKYGIVSRPVTAYENGLLELTIDEAPIPINFKIGDLFRLLAGGKQTPFVYLADISVIDGMNMKYKFLGEIGIFTSGKKMRIIKTY